MTLVIAILSGFITGLYARHILLSWQIARARRRADAAASVERVRLAEAQRLLLNGMSYEDAAKCAGFSCAGDLTGAFFRVTGKGPGLLGRRRQAD